MEYAYLVKIEEGMEYAYSVKMEKKWNMLT